jgi:hypothetical protein
MTDNFTTELQAGAVSALGAVEFDDMGNATVSITVNGKILSQTDITGKELEILALYFMEKGKK